MKVMEVQDGMSVASHCVYFNPLDKEVAISTQPHLTINASY
jgi:hypothetical protein